MNTYRYDFEARCPNDGDLIRYSLEIVASTKIMAEDLVSACSFAEPIFHEDAADQLARQFGGHHTLTAVHRSVTITTTRGGKL